VLCCVVLCCVALCCAVLCSAVVCCAVLCCAARFCDVPNFFGLVMPNVTVKLCATLLKTMRVISRPQAKSDCVSLTAAP
jgi:hypothetical protein